ncbi:MAG TPA: 3'-5' exonuclease, partial [Bryobacteraceae bacterium]|nr:3'-5' exonuclease [Bryobacteraceae bacterium]
DAVEQEKGGDALLQQLNRLRGMMLDRRLWSRTVREFEQMWTEYKRENGLHDFTDLVETAYRDVYVAPKNPSVIFADEAQDLNGMQLSLIRKWGERASYFIVAGDDDQASLPGSLILTEGAQWIPVERLDPAHHRLVSYNTVHSELKGLRKGRRFELQPTAYSGKAVRLHAGDRATATTHNHPWLFRWTAAARSKHVVYLMQKGRSFRVGWCKLVRADNCCHLGVRAHHERADAAWILRVCESRSEASLWESYIAAEYGISTALWRPIHNQQGGHYTTEVIAALAEMLGDQTERGDRCLKAFGRDINLPFYLKGKPNRHGAQIKKCAASNLLAGVMAVPVVDTDSRGGVVWRSIKSVERFQYEGCVYGLSVPPDHTYVADGIVTHNCIYSFSGATPEAMLKPEIPEDHKITLKQSYRVPRAVHRVADKLIQEVVRRQEKIYLPRDEEGTVERLTRGTYRDTEHYILKTAMEHLERGQTIMFLASCSYMLWNITQVLRKNGIPFHNPYRRTNGAWNPVRIGGRGSTASRIMALLVAHPDFGERHRPWTHGDLALWAEWLNAEGILKRGAKKRLTTFETSEQVTVERLNEIFEPGALYSLLAAYEGDYHALLEWWRARVTATVHDRVQFPADIASKNGPRALLDKPQVIVGTIHSVKGGEADVVLLFPDISRSGTAQYRSASRDSVVRLFYVGLTRARHTLYICQRETGMAVSI